MNCPEPSYAQIIVVGIRFHHTFAWYVTKREYWYLDYRKYQSALFVLGSEDLLLEDYSERFGIAVLNEDTAASFLSSIKKFHVPAVALTEMMLTQRQLYEENGSLNSLEYYNDILDFIPCFFVNFDQKQFSSLYPEMIRFENYIPDGWTGSHRDFLPEIPEKERYWIVDKQDLFKRQ